MEKESQMSNDEKRDRIDLFKNVTRINDKQYFEILNKMDCYAVVVGQRDDALKERDGARAALEQRDKDHGEIIAGYKARLNG